MVSGTNGKTTTTRFVAEALRTAGPVATNALGANMPSGITAAFVEARGSTRFAVAEVDERYLPDLLRQTRPKTVVLLNLSRDQLDRTPECWTIADLWRRALAVSDATVVANADDPLVVWAASAATNVVWATVGQRWTADSWYCPGCWSRLDRPHWTDWVCGQCGLSRPVPHWELDDEVALDVGAGDKHSLALRLPGRANRANAVMALAATAAAGVRPQDALARISDVEAVAGRYGNFEFGGRQVRLLLAKNPASWLETLELIGGSALLSFNARDLDGLDTSWLWDVDFTALRGRRVMVMGERRFDLAVRLRYDLVDFTVVDSLDEACAVGAHGRLDVVANYTAFLSVITAIRAGERGPTGVHQ